MEKLRAEAAALGLEVSDAWSCEEHNKRVSYMVHGKYFGMRSISNAIAYLTVERETMKTAEENASKKRKHDAENEIMPQLAPDLAPPAPVDFPAPVASSVPVAPVAPVAPVDPPAPVAPVDPPAPVAPVAPVAPDANQQPRTYVSFKVIVVGPTGYADARELHFNARPTSEFYKVMNSITERLNFPFASILNITFPNGTSLNAGEARNVTITQLGIVDNTTPIMRIRG